MYKRSISQWQTVTLRINKNEKGVQKLTPPSYFAWRTTEEIPLKFNSKLFGYFLHFILFLHRQEWPECVSKIIWNKNEKKYLCAHFSMLTGPFKQIRVERGHQAMVSHWHSDQGTQTEGEGSVQLTSLY